eukprot:85511-Chlamydomonas_euryale.AAC.1
MVMQHISQSLGQVHLVPAVGWEPPGASWGPMDASIRMAAQGVSNDLDLPKLESGVWRCVPQLIGCTQCRVSPLVVAT